MVNRNFEILAFGIVTCTRQEVMLLSEEFLYTRIQRFSKILQQHSKSRCHVLTNQNSAVKRMRKEPPCGVAGQPHALRVRVRVRV